MRSVRHWSMWWNVTSLCARVFRLGEGGPEQVVYLLQRLIVVVGCIDAHGWSAAELREAVEAVARGTFDLNNEIPLRATLFQVDEDEHVLAAVVHHIAADGWSVAPLVADLQSAYASRSAGRTPEWAPLPVQYVDYTAAAGRIWAIWPIPTAVSRGRWRIGSRHWPDFPNGWSCRRIGHIRRWRITGVPVWRCRCPPNCTSGFAMSLVSTT